MASFAVQLGTVIMCIAVLFQYLSQKNFSVHYTGGVLVTGASSGIGRHAALRLAGEGYTVFAGVRKDSDVESLKTAVFDTSNNGEMVPVKLDGNDKTHPKIRHNAISKDINILSSHVRGECLGLCGRHEGAAKV